MSNAYYILRANETLSVLPYHRHISPLLHLTKEEKLSFESIVFMITRLYNNLFSCSSRTLWVSIKSLYLPRTNILQEITMVSNSTSPRPFIPPLLRSASIWKFLVGYVLSCHTLGPAWLVSLRGAYISVVCCDLSSFVGGRPASFWKFGGSFGRARPS